MNKRNLIKPWYFLVLALVSAVVCVFALRANNQHMIKLRDAVIAADKNNTDVLKPLQTLQAYVTGHMNTDLSAGNTSVYPPIQLQYTYDRLNAAQTQQSSNTAVYSQAQAFCEGQNSTDFSGRNRVPCIEQYVLDHGGKPATPVSPDLLKFSFVSPRWSADLAGWSMAAAILFFLLFVITLIVKLLRKLRK